MAVYLGRTSHRVSTRALFLASLLHTYSCYCFRFVVLPLTCMVKGRIAGISSAFRAKEPYPVITEMGLRLEEALLIAFALATVVAVWNAAASDTGKMAAVKEAVYTSLCANSIAFASEIVSLVGQYLFCRICCKCCLPGQAEFNDELVKDLAGAYGADKA